MLIALTERTSAGGAKINGPNQFGPAKRPQLPNGVLTAPANAGRPAAEGHAAIPSSD
jgi:hypothetical protein